PGVAAGSGSASPARRPALRTSVPPRARARDPARYPSALLAARRQFVPQERCNFFLELDERLGPRGTGTKTPNLTLELQDALGVGVRSPRLGPTLLRGEARELAAGACRTPRRQVRRVQALAPQHRSQLARLGA